MYVDTGQFYTMHCFNFSLSEYVLKSIALYVILSDINVNVKYGTHAMGVCIAKHLVE